MDWTLIISAILNVTFLIIILGQSRKIDVLRETNKKNHTEIYNEQLIALVKEKLNSIGEVKTVKYVREETGMSMLEAKRLVDNIKA